MSEWTLHEWVAVSLPAAALIIALLAWLMPRQSRIDVNRDPPRYDLYRRRDFPTVHSMNGIPTLPQLTDGMGLDSKGLGIAEGLYETGLAQFNHYVNNRDGVIQRSRHYMAKLANCLSQSDVALAERIGTSMAADCTDDHKAAVQSQYDDLSPQAQIYAQHKRLELNALRRNARDLEKNVPRTDYTSVKARIASGTVSLDAVTSELPIHWQAIRSLNDRVERPKEGGRPPKREFLHLSLMTTTGLLEDNRAEKDGDWIISDKHGVMVPYQEPIPIFELRAEGMPPVQKVEIVAISQDPTSEWDTEFWRRGGRLDQVYLRSKNGQSPKQLRSAYRRRIIRNVGWAFAGAIAVVDIVIVATKFL